MLGIRKNSSPVPKTLILLIQKLHFLLQLSVVMLQLADNEHILFRDSDCPVPTLKLREGAYMPGRRNKQPVGVS